MYLHLKKSKYKKCLRIYDADDYEDNKEYKC